MVLLKGRGMPGGVRAWVALGALTGLVILPRPSVASTQDVPTAQPSADRKATPSTRADADAGDPAAQFKMGVAHEYGEGVSQDYAQAAAWYRKAADQEHARSEAPVLAQFALAVLYERGQGVPQNFAQAAAFYRKAANRGHRGAQAALSVLCTSGQGVTQDLVEAHMWLNIAASRASGDEHTKFAAARDSLAARMTPVQIAEAQRRATSWRPVE
jgi:TPR repeat protein